MKKKLGLLGVLAVAAMALVAAPAAASATETCVPQDAVAAYDETIVDAEAYDETVVITPAVPGEWVNWNWNGGPVEGEPAWPGEGWHSNQGDHSGHPQPVDGEPGFTYDRSNESSGNADWFHWEWVEGTDEVTEVVHHDAVTHVVNHPAIPAVVCPPPTTQYSATCTSVTDSAVLTGDGVIVVEGDWDSAIIPVPSVSTLADIGTVLMIDADPLQYVGLHIHTAEGTIVFEEEPSYGGKLWSTTAWDGVPAGMGYAAFGTIEEFITLNGDVAVTGIDLLYTSPEASSTTVTSFIIGCTAYTFAPAEVPPTEEPPVVTPPVVAPPAAPAPAAPAVVTVAEPTSSELAETGFDAMWLPWVAALMLGGGAAALIAKRVARARATK